jgi:hypothetical protein
MILGLELQRAGISFLEAKAVTRNGFMRATVVVSSEADLKKFEDWAARNAVALEGARVATPEELAEYAKLQEML